VLRTNTCVIYFNKRIPKRHKKWLQTEYVQVAHEIWVAGATLPPETGGRRFAIARPALYRVMGAGGPVAAVIDGRPCDGPVFLEPGEHRLEGAGGEPLAVVWSKTCDAGLNPFTTREQVCTLVNDEL